MKMECVLGHKNISLDLSTQNNVTASGAASSRIARPRSPTSHHSAAARRWAAGSAQTAESAASAARLPESLTGETSWAGRFPPLALGCRTRTASRRSSGSPERPAASCTPGTGLPGQQQTASEDARWAAQDDRDECCLHSLFKPATSMLCRLARQQARFDIKSRKCQHRTAVEARRVRVVVVAGRPARRLRVVEAPAAIADQHVQVVAEQRAGAFDRRPSLRISAAVAKVRDEMVDLLPRHIPTTVPARAPRLSASGSRRNFSD